VAATAFTQVTGSVYSPVMDARYSPVKELHLIFSSE